jgi:predicted small lipoprotein YifL
MKYLMTIAAVTALAACGVDGAPIRPGSQNELAPARNATPAPANGMIGGTMSVHTATTL